MTDRLKVLFISLFTSLPWLVAAGMALWMAYQTTDPRAAEIGRAIQASLISGLVLFALIAATAAWQCLSLNWWTLRGWWAARISLWVLLGLWGALVVRTIDAPKALANDPGAIGQDVRLLTLATLVLITLASMAFVERRRPEFRGRMQADHSA